MMDVQLTTKEIVGLLVKHGDEFVCCKERAGVSPLECGVPTRRISSSRLALRKQIDSADFHVSVSLDGVVKTVDEKAMWSVCLKAKFGARSPGGARRVNLVYEVVGPTPAQLLMLYQSNQIALVSKVTGLPPKRTIKSRTDTL